MQKCKNCKSCKQIGKRVMCTALPEWSEISNPNLHYCSLWKEKSEFANEIIIHNK